MIDTKVLGVGMGVITVLLLLVLLVLSGTNKPPLGSASPGLPATVASTSAPTLTTVVAQGLFATSTCSARIITTGASAIKLTFTDKDGQSPNGALGELQAASTTVVYDSGLYGCGFVRGYSFLTQIVSLTDVR